MAGPLDGVKAAYKFLFEKKKMPTGIVGSAALFIALVIVFSYSASSLEDEVMSLDQIMDKLGEEVKTKKGPNDNPFPTDEFSQAEGDPTTVTGTGEEGTDATESLSLGQENLISITFVLTWTDEPDRNVLWINQPDSFGLEVSGPNNQSGSAPMVSNGHGQEGKVELTVTVEHEDSYDGLGVGEWEYTIKCGDCGNQERRRPALIGFTDSGNDWSLSISYNYYQEV